MKQDILELVKKLSLKDTKSLSQKVLKLSSECGELASKTLTYENASGERSKFVSKEELLDEVADVMLVALSIAYSLNYTDDDISSMMYDKARKWSDLNDQDKSDGKYPFEIHLTVGVKYLQGFIESCNNMGDVKPILLDLYNEETEYADIQVTTSTVILGSLNDAISKMVDLVKRLEATGVWVLRQKIETVPWHPAIKTFNGKYFESHVTILLDSKEDLSDLREMCKGSNLHISQNVLKPTTNNGLVKVMGTVRSDAQTHDLEDHMDDLNTALDYIKFTFNITKSITEYTVLDSNEALDAKWLGKL